VVSIEADSYRLREAKQRTEQKARERAARRDKATRGAPPIKT
jgi:hypothetical protein